MSTRNALLALVAGTLIGIVGTLVAGSEPGFLLSLFIIVGAIVATLGVRPGAVYLFFPLPAFAFFAGAVITGKIHDSSLSSSTAGLAAGFTQWVAGIFFPMCAATILVLLIGGARWLLSRQLVGGQFPMSETARGPPAARGPAARTSTRGPTRRRPGTGPASVRATPPGPAPTAPGPPARPATTAIPGTIPGPRPIPARAADRRPPSRNAPPAAPQPAFRPRPANPGPPGPGDPRAQRPPAPQRPARPPRDPWDQR